MLFDEIGFKVEAFALVFYAQEINRFRLSKHFLLPNAPWSEVLAHSLFQIFRFSDIENLPFLVFEKVHSRRIREMGDGRRIKHNRKKMKSDFLTIVNLPENAMLIFNQKAPFHS